ncbi:hypothetical protein BC628DRAFT_1418658 [Trametes gibbosa]|nr:hypothetical protein BC628DRAFT_1418658 [Trametes gibbosa]
MSSKTRTIYQNLIDDEYPPITLQDEVLESKLTKELLDSFFEGILHLATTKAIVVQFHAKDKGANAYKGRGVLSSEVSCNSDVILLAFSFNKLAIALSCDQDLRVLNGIDVQSSCGSDSDRSPSTAIKYATAGVAAVMEANIDMIFKGEMLDPRRTTASVLQAWVAQCI